MIYVKQSLNIFCQSALRVRPSESLCANYCIVAVKDSDVNAFYALESANVAK